MQYVKRTVWTAVPNMILLFSDGPSTEDRLKDNRQKADRLKAGSLNADSLETGRLTDHYSFNIHVIPSVSELP